MSLDERLRTTFQAELAAAEARRSTADRRSTAASRPGARWRRRIVLMAAAGVVLVAAAGLASLLLGSQPPEHQLDTVDQAPTTDPSTTTTPTTTPTTVEASTTTAPAEDTTTNAPPVTASPAPAPTPAVTPAGVNRAGGFAVALVGDRGEVVAIDLATGSIDRVIATIDVEARTIGRFQLDWAGTTLYHHVLTEDHWFSCESSPGTIMSLDLTTGETTVVGLGVHPRVSPDGRHLAYLAASQCLPDPGDPGNFVLTPYDSVVIRDLATGQERTWVDTELAEALATGEGDAHEAQHGGLVWLSPDELAVSRLRLAVDTLEVTTADVSFRGEAGTDLTVIGVDPREGLVLVEWDRFDDDGIAHPQLGSIDPRTAELVIEAQLSDRGLFAFDSSNTNLAVVDGGELVVDGRLIPVEVEIHNLDW